jgi:hypothetical protein
MQKRDTYRDLVKFGVENSSTPVPSKAPQGSKQHKVDVLTYVNKVVADNEPKIANQKIFENNINKKPVYQYPRQADPETFGKAAARVERARQMAGGEPEMSTWNLLKKAADTPEEKKEIRAIIQEDYKKHGPKDMDPDDLKWIGKGKVTAGIKIDVKGISDSVNTYINAQRKFMEPSRPPPKEIDPDLNSGVASLLGEIYDR